MTSSPARKPGCAGVSTTPARSMPSTMRKAARNRRLAGQREAVLVVDGRMRDARPSRRPPSVRYRPSRRSGHSDRRRSCRRGWLETSCARASRREFSFGPVEDQDIQIPRRREIGVADFEQRRPDLLHAVGAEADERIRRALVDRQMKISDRSGPIGAGGQTRRRSASRTSGRCRHAVASSRLPSAARTAARKRFVDAIGISYSLRSAGSIGSI